MTWARTRKGRRRRPWRGVGQRPTLACLLLLAAAVPALAHSLSTSYLTLATDNRTLHVQWEIALRDLDYAVGLDPAGRITWGDVRTHARLIESYALPRLTLTADHRPCRPNEPELLADEHGGNGYAVLRFDALCPVPVHTVGIATTLMFALDPEHRALVDVVSGSAFHVAVLSPAHPAVTIDAASRLSQTFAEFFEVGVRHILSGPDHLLFIALLLFPAMFRRHQHGRVWIPVERFRPAFSRPPRS